METISLLLGILAGGVVASLIWIITKVLIGSKQKALLNERNSYINSIGELIAEADTLLVSFSIGSASRDRMKSEITRLMEAIRKLYKPNIHLFEVFYVKYIEITLTHYTSYLKENSSGQNNWDEPVHRSRVSVPVDKVISSKDSVSIPVAAPLSVQEVPVEMAQAESVVSMHTSEENENDEAVLFGTNGGTENESLVAEDINLTIEPVSAAHLEILPVEDADMPEFAPEVQDLSNDSVELQKEESIEIAAASTPAEQDAEVSFEEMAQDVLAVDEVHETGFSSIANKPLEDQVEQIRNVEIGDSESEEFSMETIMDLDMSKIPGFNSEKSKITIKAQTEKPVEHKSDDSEISFEPGKGNFTSQEVTMSQPESVSGISPVSGAEIKTPMSFGKQKAELAAKMAQTEMPPDSNRVPSNGAGHVVREPNQNNTEKEHYTITGDDVADQIDSFFGFNK